MHHLDKVYGFKKVVFTPEVPAVEGEEENSQQNSDTAKKSFLARNSLLVKADLELVVYQELGNVSAGPGAK